MEFPRTRGKPPGNSKKSDGNPEKQLESSQNQSKAIHHREIISKTTGNFSKLKLGRLLPGGHLSGCWYLAVPQKTGIPKWNLGKVETKAKTCGLPLRSFHFEPHPKMGLTGPGSHDSPGRQFGGSAWEPQPKPFHRVKGGQTSAPQMCRAFLVWSLSGFPSCLS